MQTEQAKEQQQETATATAEGGTVTPVQFIPGNHIRSGCQQVPAQLQDMLKQVATYQRGKNLADPVPYRLLASPLLDGSEIPPVQNNMTQIRQVPARGWSFLSNKVESGNHVVLINEVESSFPMHRSAGCAPVNGYGSGGAGHVDAQRHGLITELAVFLRRLPKLLDYQFMGGQPFADDLARLWIESEVLAGAKQCQQAHQGKQDIPRGWKYPAGPGNLPPRGSSARVLRCFRKDAAGRFGGKRFMWDLHQARFCQEAGYVEVAIPQLESLDDEAEHFTLRMGACPEPADCSLTTSVLYKD